MLPDLLSFNFVIKPAKFPVVTDFQARSELETLSIVLSRLKKFTAEVDEIFALSK